MSPFPTSDLPENYCILKYHTLYGATLLMFQRDLTITVNADETLDSFCKWQMGLNHPEDSHPNHHDVAILVTRYVWQSLLLSVCNKQVSYGHTIHNFNMWPINEITSQNVAFSGVTQPNTLKS
jgi:hypothetical protein